MYQNKLHLLLYAMVYFEKLDDSVLQNVIALPILRNDKAKFSIDIYWECMTYMKD